MSSPLMTCHDSMPVRASRHNLKLSYRLQHSLRRENIPWDALDFPDNQAQISFRRNLSHSAPFWTEDSVDLLAGKGTGVFARTFESWELHILIVGA